MKAKFTKGPWVKDSRGECLINPDGENIIVWGCGLSSATKTVERVANADLIATAPELYELLFYIANGEIRAYAHKTRIDKLLAKARGE